MLRAEKDLPTLATLLSAIYLQPGLDMTQDTFCLTYKVLFAELKLVANT
jgi:hypothetical protein